VKPITVRAVPPLVREFLPLAGTSSTTRRPP
jgi:hypothetical protein